MRFHTLARQYDASTAHAGAINRKSNALCALLPFPMKLMLISFPPLAVITPEYRSDFARNTHCLRELPRAIVTAFRADISRYAQKVNHEMAPERFSRTFCTRERMKTVSPECRRQKSPQIGGKKASLKKYCNVNRLIGWGGRTRTSEWRNQNPLPYHLATPQKLRRRRGP